jgi:hypothetical protein
MGWILALGIVGGSVFLAFLLTRTTHRQRRRSAQWNDLHERGRLISAQLTHLRAAETRRAAPAAPPGPPAKPAGKPRFSWRRRPSAPPARGEPPPAPIAPVSVSRAAPGRPAR